MPAFLSYSMRRYLSLFGICWLLVLVLYHQQLHAQFNDDFIAGIRAYKALGPSGFWTSFHFTSMYYGHDLFYYGFYLLFGLNEYAWLLYNTALQAINAVLIILVVESALQKHEFSNSRIAAYITALLFIFCPYQTENVTWGATIHYQVAMIGMLTGILLVKKYTEQSRLLQLLLLYGVFTFTLVTLEEALVFPAVWGIFYLIYETNINRQTITKGTKILVIPLTVLMGIYFGATWALKGSIIPHYGSDIHMANWAPKLVLACYTKYLVKLLGFVHFFSYEVRDKIYSLCDKGKFLAALWIPIVASLAYLYTTKYRKGTLALVALLALAFFTLLPSLNMYFMYLNRVENDRLSFFATPFVYCLPAFFVTRFRPWVWVPFTIALLILMQQLLSICNSYWVNAAEIQKRTLDSLHFEGKRKLYVVNLPVNFSGAYIYRSYWRLPAAMNVLRGKDISKQLEVVAGQNMFSMTDSVRITIIDSVTYKANIVGTGWFYNNVNNSDGKGEGYNFDTPNGNECIIHLNQPLANDEAIIYQSGGNWSEAKRWAPALNQ